MNCWHYLIDDICLDKINMFRKIKRRLDKKKKTAAFPPDKMRRLLDMLMRTEPEEISCDDVSAALAEFAEMHQRGEVVKHLMPFVHQHLEMCRDCREEYEALMAALEAQAQIY
jgi:hypothetical protein